MYSKADCDAFLKHCSGDDKSALTSIDHASGGNRPAPVEHQAQAPSTRRAAKPVSQLAVKKSLAEEERELAEDLRQELAESGRSETP